MRVIQIFFNHMEDFLMVLEVEKSFVTLPEITGIGFEGKSDLFSIMKQMVA